MLSRNSVQEGKRRKNSSSERQFSDQQKGRQQGQSDGQLKLRQAFFVAPKPPHQFECSA